VVDTKVEGWDVVNINNCKNYIKVKYKWQLGIL